MSLLQSIRGAAGRAIRRPRQVTEDEFKRWRRESLDPAVRNGACYVPMPGLESTRHYKDKQNRHHLGRYEWASHVNTARNNDVPEDAIEAVRHSADVSGLSEDYRDIVTFVRQLLQTNKVDQTLFDSMIKRKGIRWVVEITATAGQYQYISAINNAFDLQPAADADQLEVP